MTPEALESFLSVVSSFKNIIQTFENPNIKYSIKEGSAVFSAIGTKNDVDEIYLGINTAIRCKSTNRVLTKNLKLIKEQISKEEFEYDFVYKRQGDANIDLASRLLKSKISQKREKKEFIYRLRVLQGFLNQIGGKDPNYHFDYGNGIKKTISCTMNDVSEIINYLYRDISVLVISKENNKHESIEYLHKYIIDGDILHTIKPFILEYYSEANFVKRLEKIHDFIYTNIEKSDLGYLILEMLLNCFNNKNLHLSEIKTLLIVSKFYMDNEAIIVARNSLLETYQIIKSENTNV